MSAGTLAAAPAAPCLLSAGRFWTLFLCLLALAAVPVLLAALPPLFDYPNHLARMYLLIHVPESAALQRYYEIRWHALPNLAMDLLVPPLARLMPLGWAGRAFILLALGVLAAGSALLHRAATGRWSIWPLFAFLFLYSRVLLWGFLNYLLGVGLALVGLAGWIWLERRNRMLRLAVSTGFALALFFCHLMAWAIYGVLVAGYELGQARLGGRWLPRQALGRLVIAGLPFLPTLAILLLAGEGGGLGGIHYGRFVRKLDLTFSVFDNYHRAVDVACFAALVLAAVYAYARRYLVLAPALRWPLVLLTAAFVLAPTQLMTASAVDHRMPLAIAVVLAAATTAPVLRPRAVAAIAVTGLALFGLRMGLVSVQWERAQSTYARDLAILDQVPEGGRLAVAFPASAIASDPTPTTHLPTLAAIRREAFVPTLFAYGGQQPLAFTLEAQRLADRAEPSALWRALTGGTEAGTLEVLRDFDAVVVLDRHPFAVPANVLLKPVTVEPDFALYRIER
jgi:hypothetical protein